MKGEYPLTTIAVTAIDASFQRVAPRGAKLAEVFYDRLFEQFPETKLLFEQRQADMVRQRIALLQALSQVIEGLKSNDLVGLSAKLRELGQRHSQEYGVLPQHYEWVGKVLLETLRQFDPEWTARLQGEWAGAYGAIVSLMNPAAEAAT